MKMLLLVALFVFLILAVICGVSYLIDKTTDRDDAHAG